MLAKPSRRLLAVCLAALLGIVSVGPSLNWAYHLGDNGRLAAGTEWQAALTFLREETPQDAIVMSWWDYGYWILDMADRRPVVDNGYYGWDEKRLEDVSLAYCTSDPSEAARVMQEYGADYLVFSRLEVRTLPVITEYGLGESSGDGLSVPREMRDSLFYQSLYGGFKDGGGLTSVYPSSDMADPEVVILKLE
jgi:asparagine N-glycosylation enzyme membrane subunit Stt3